MIAGTMNPQLMWWFARATGMVAGIVLVASVVFGVLFTTRALKPNDRPMWIREMHRWLSSVACVLIGLHLFGLVADNFVHFGWKEVFVPGGSAWKTRPVAVGVVAMYLLAIVQGTSMMMHRLPRNLWKFLHYFSYAAVWLASIHGAYAGTDAHNILYRVIAVTLTAVAMGAGVVRVIVGTTRAQAARRAEHRRLAAQAGQATPAAPRSQSSRL